MSIFFGKRNNVSEGKTDSPENPEASDKAPQPDNRNVSIPLYVAGGVVQLSALTAVAYQISEPAFAYFTFILTILGLVVSYHLRCIGTSPRLIFMGTLFLGAIFLFALRGSGVFGAIIPLEIQGSQEILLISALAFTATFSSFLLLTDESVIFTCVWAIAIIGLTGTVNINRELIISFIFFLAGASFLLIHQNAIAQSVANRPRLPWRGRRRQGITEPVATGPHQQKRLILTQVVMAATAWIASIILGFLVAIPVQMVGRNLSLATIIQRLKVPPSAAGRGPSLPRLVFDDLNKFNVGLGPVDDDQTERMTVLTEEPHYWRGRAYDRYTGKGWVSTLADQAEEIVPQPSGETEEGFSTFELKSYGGKRAKVDKQTHRFHINGGVFGPIYHAAEPRIVRAPVGRIAQRPDNTIGTGRGGGSDYEVDSEIVRFTATDLKNSGTNYPDDITERYLNQGQTNDALRALMLEATADAKADPFARVQAIRNYISQRCVYTRDARAVPRDRDAAEFFLNESKEGYCDLYATSMAVLCRYAGIPARVATGFAPGSPDTNNPTNPKDPRTRYILRGADQHAWTEVYFNGFGWIPFDATQDTLGLQPPASTPEPERKESPFEKWMRTGKFSIGLIALGVVGVLFVLWNEYAGRNAGMRGVRTPGKTRAGLIHRIYNTSLHQVSRRAFPREATETPSEYVERLNTRFDTEVANAVGKLTGIAERAFYGPDDVTDRDIGAAKEASGAISKSLAGQKERARKNSNAGPVKTGGSEE